jgi:mannose-6-phosphate isomerase
MSASPMYPLRFEPILRRLIWGGRKLGSVLHKPIGPENDYAESWELSDYKDSVSIVSEGELAGESLRDLVQSRGRELLGPSLADRDQFPLLVKFIDAREALSVQVHPDDIQGKALAGDNGKTETWVVIDAEPGSLIYAGLKAGVARDDLHRAIETGAVEPLLHRFEPKPGDCVMIEAGTVHAIGAGVLLAEIQQMSDATFRVFDWGRVGLDGKPRQLHISQALESTNFDRGPVNPLPTSASSTPAGNQREKLSRCPYFALERLRLSRAETVGHHDGFTILMGLESTTLVAYQGRECRLEFGQTLLLPAAIGPSSLTPVGESTILTCVIPES